MKDFRQRLFKIGLALLGIACALIGFAWSASASPGAARTPPLVGRAFFPSQQSTTGFIPPLAVQRRDAGKPPDSPENLANEALLSVPAYLWRHGCGPTAVGMILGYYDSLGFEDLISGSALTQTEAVNQAIASGGDALNPFPPGLESHYEDYARPQDDPPPLIEDDYITNERVPHDDNSIADYMDTSKSTRDNLYGWSWSTDIGPAYVAFVNQQNPTYLADYQPYLTSDESLTWSVLTAEIDAGRPMIFLVDSDGDGTTDHFMPVIGYREIPTRQYGAWDTWSTSAVRWEAFEAIAPGTPWGIFGALAFSLRRPESTATASPTPTATATGTSTPTPTSTSTSTATPTPTGTPTAIVTQSVTQESAGRAIFELFLPVVNK